MASATDITLADRVRSAFGGALGTDARTQASAQTVATAAGGVASASVSGASTGLRGLFQGALDEYHEQEDRFRTLTILAVIALALIVVAVLAFAGVYVVHTVKEVL